MNKIRVAFFAEILIRDFDGASRTIFQIIDRIPNSTFEFLFICGTPPTEELAFETVILPSVTLPFNNNYKMAIPYLSNKKINKKLKKFKPDIIHISTPSLLGNFGLDFAVSHGLPVITIYHTHFVSYIDYYLEKASLLVNPVKNIMIQKLTSFYQHCDMVYVPTHAMHTELKSLKIVNNNIKIWPRGINNNLFNLNKRNLKYIRLLTHNDRPNILFASRLVWEKNLKTLIQMYKLAKDQSLYFNFIVAGDGVASDTLKNEMPNAIFTGALDHDTLSVLYASCDVFVFTSVSETFGNVVVEAMASGLPCVIANGGGSSGLVMDGVNGFLCDPFEPQQYLEKIILLSEDDNLRNKMIEQSLLFTKTLNWDLLTDIYFDDITAMTKYPRTLKNITI